MDENPEAFRIEFVDGWHRLYPSGVKLAQIDATGDGFKVGVMDELHEPAQWLDPSLDVHNLGIHQYFLPQKIIDCKTERHGVVQYRCEKPSPVHRVRDPSASFRLELLFATHPAGE